MIEFTWHINYRCNYRCAYCWFDDKWDAWAGEGREYPPAERWAEAWERVYERYGQASIDILGGEPLLYPGFAALLSSLSKRHRVGFTTNLFISPEKVEELAAAVDPSRVHIGASFHPDYADFDEFMAKFAILKRRGICSAVHIVAYPPFLKDLPRLFSRCESAGAECKVMPFLGAYEGKRYPESYSGEERRLLGRLLVEPGQKGYVVELERTRGEPCHSGSVYGSVKPDGDVHRCGGAGGKDVVGNLFDPGFRMREGPTPCPVEHCVCQEYRYLAAEYDKRERVSALSESLVWLGHSGVLVDGPLKIYIDPFELEGGLPPADLILVTHPHYDHCSKADVDRIAGPETVIAGPEDCLKKLGRDGIIMRPGDERTLRGVPVRAVPAYGVNRRYHPKDRGWLGFVLELGGRAPTASGSGISSRYRSVSRTLYHAGDTEELEELKGLSPDIALLPVDDIYNTGPFDAMKLAVLARTVMAVPVHYWPVCGTEADAAAFIRDCRRSGILADKLARFRLPARNRDLPGVAPRSGKRPLREAAT